ncbi:sugar phosphate isomerase/epimerase [Niabella pedocola]|uniref:Sugar phosphate isomerase/epimerase n=1 Tax=Niabella pedocola TaxID=1752077 RepID=A0ABS8PRQ4_9BACT|nr:sugar phosphate isomerase/epimerase [Niabella pedocola]MCD2423770.1 sugar phosphate isomerase/epimerase [Niabella pedocola]
MNRSAFLKTIAAGTAGLYTTNLFAGSVKKKYMAMQLFSVREAVAKNLEGTLEKLVGIGYNELEIYGYDGSFFGKTRAEFSSILKNTGVKVVSSHHLTGFQVKSKGTLKNGWEQAVEDLHAIGARYMACAYLFPEERTPEIYAALPDLLNKSGEKAAAAGMGFAYHNHDFEFEKYNNTLVYDHLITNTNPKLVNMELDLYWISKAGQDPVAYFNKYPGRFPLWHVKDMEAGTGAITEVGHGTIDFDRIFAARKTAGLKKWFVEQDTSKGDMFESLKFSHDHLATKKYI